MYSEQASCADMRHPATAYRLWGGRSWLPCLLAALLLFNGCAGKPPLALLPADRLPAFTDDLDRDSLKASINRSLHYLRKLPAERMFTYADATYSAAWLIESMETFQRLLETTGSDAELARQIGECFLVYQIGPRDDDGAYRQMLVTGYYEPLFEASLTREPPYSHPLYALPPDLVTQPGQENGARRSGRLKDGRLVPYWSRAEIENQNLLAGHELVYLADPVEAFILQIQGSGKVRLRDGSIRAVGYAGSNGHPYRSIGRLLVDEGRMELAEVNMPAIRAYLADHPAEQTRILHHNPSFVFFRWHDGEGPVGNLGEPLTAGRSVAADQNILPAAGLGFLQSEKPTQTANGLITWQPLSRFVLIQDSGGAIKGPGRLDLFWGGGDYAETAAGLMKQPGRLYLLVKKQP